MLAMRSMLATPKCLRSGPRGTHPIATECERVLMAHGTCRYVPGTNHRTAYRIQPTSFAFPYRSFDTFSTAELCAPPAASQLISPVARSSGRIFVLGYRASDYETGVSRVRLSFVPVARSPKSVGASTTALLTALLTSGGLLDASPRQQAGSKPGVVRPLHYFFFLASLPDYPCPVCNMFKNA